MSATAGLLLAIDICRKRHVVVWGEDALVREDRRAIASQRA
jgi:hypothetical protein